MLLAAVLAWGAAVAVQPRVVPDSADWVLTLHVPDTVYAGAEILAKLDLKLAFPAARYVYPWMGPGLRQTPTERELDVDVQTDDGTPVPSTRFVAEEIFIDWKHVVRQLFTIGDSMTTYVSVSSHFRRLPDQAGVLPPGAYRITATCSLSESAPGERSRTAYVRSNTGSVVVAVPPEQLAAAYTQLLRAVQTSEGKWNRSRPTARDKALGQLRSLAFEHAGTRIGSWAAAVLVREMMLDVAYRSADLGRFARETGSLLLANTNDELLVPSRAWTAYLFLKNRDPTMAENLLTWWENAAPGTRLVAVVRRAAIQEVAGARRKRR
jgi:hypothetical protein